MFKGKKILSRSLLDSILLSMVIFLGAILLFSAGCDKGGGGSANPAAPSGTGGIKGTLYQDRNLQLASLSPMQGLWIVLSDGAESLFYPASAYAAVQMDISNTSPSSGILVELLLNGTVIASTTTGPNGKFEFSGIGPGEYVIRFSKGDELLVTTNVTVKDGATTEIEGKITLASSGNIHIAMEIEKHREVDHYFEHEKKDSEKNKEKIKDKEKKKGDKDDDNSSGEKD